jgi:cyanophycinase-like exopeptidase
MTMTTKGHAYLAASPQGETLPTMIKRALGGIRGRKARVAVSHAAVADSLPGRMYMKAFARKAFWGAEVHVLRVAGEHGATDPAAARRIVEEADLVFLSGGDPVLGARILVESGADAWIREARARGASCMGFSAGAMMLCEHWASWPDPPDAEAPFHGGALVRCTGVVEDLVVDCHAEDDGWAELALVSAMLEARGGPVPRRLGLASGAGIVVAPDGSIEPIGGAPFELT